MVMKFYYLKIDKIKFLFIYFYCKLCYKLKSRLNFFCQQSPYTLFWWEQLNFKENNLHREKEYVQQRLRNVIYDQKVNSNQNIYFVVL